MVSLEVETMTVHAYKAQGYRILAAVWGFRSW